MANWVTEMFYLVLHYNWTSLSTRYLFLYYLLIVSFLQVTCSCYFFDQLHNLSKRRMEEAMKLREINIKEERAKGLARQEKERHEAAKREAEYVRECAEREASQRREAEMKAIHDAKEKKKFENALVGPVQQYHKFTWEEIVSATSSFSEDLKIGMGAYGSVYKCNLHHTTAAVKILHSEDSHKNKQFLQEVNCKDSPLPPPPPKKKKKCQLNEETKIVL